MATERHAVAFTDHEGDTVFVNPETVTYVRSHRCNRPDVQVTDPALTDLMLINGASIPVTVAPQDAALALFVGVKNPGDQL